MRDLRPTDRPHRFMRQRLSIAILIVLTLVAAAVALGVGRYPVSFGQALSILFGNLFHVAGDWSTVMENTVMNLRLPRVIAALLIGAALAESGAVYQGIFRNPMVSPDLLGVSSGACVGAAAGILLGLGSAGIQVSAFLVAIIAVALAVSIPRLFKNDSVLMLVLSGVVVCGFMTSVLGLMKFIADPNSQLADIVFWTMGSLNDIDDVSLARYAPVIVICGVLLLLLRWRINVLALSDEQAHYLGADVSLLRLFIILCTTLMTASAVCLSGTIGWVGLVIPHMSRLLVGNDNRFCIPASIVFGALFMLVADTLARTLSDMSIPISVITGIVGAPLFIVLLAMQRRTIR
jgi:iron complex transport system permease protein